VQSEGKKQIKNMKKRREERRGIKRKDVGMT
jgi:hypothetical protein